jgi:uncharacterized protein YigE (DUF2233 family)
MRRLAAGAVLLAAMALPAAAGCGEADFEDKRYTVCRYDPADVKLELYNLNDEGQPFARFDSLAAHLAQEKKELIFATNAGMFDDALKPIGLYIEDGELRKKLNRRNGAGNFHLKPNGVFWIDGAKAGVSETEVFLRSGRKPTFATQSGPMLVINGRIHPKFSPDGTSLKIRNGVGVTDTGEVIFAISEQGVSFHEFARLFRDQYGCDEALFLDGSISGLYSVETGQRGGYLPLGPMVGAYRLN